MTAATAKSMLQAQESGLTWGQIQELTRWVIDQVRPHAQESIDHDLLDELQNLLANVETCAESDWTALKLKAFRHISRPVSPVVSRLAGAGRSPFVALSCLHYCADDVQRLLGEPGFLNKFEDEIRRLMPES